MQSNSRNNLRSSLKYSKLYKKDCGKFLTKRIYIFRTLPRKLIIFLIETFSFIDFIIITPKLYLKS